ncbi:MAG: Ig-like domain-containing protein [Terriglobales bacterium]
MRLARHVKALSFLFFFAALVAGTAPAQTLPTQTLMWSSPNPGLLYQPVNLYAEVIGNGSLAPTGTVTFENSGTQIGSANVGSFTDTNLLLYSQQFSNQPWSLMDNNSVLTPNYTTSPLGDQTAYRYQNISSQYGTDIYQSISGLPGTEPVTFSVWVESNTAQDQDLEIAVIDSSGETDAPCYATSNWQRCTVTTPDNPTSMFVQIGSTLTQWPWDVSIWGAQAEVGASAGPYIASTTAPATATMGFATFTTSQLNLGLSTLTAVYGGDGNYLQSEYTNYGQGTNSLQIIAFCLWPEMTSSACRVVELPDQIPGVPYSTALSAVGGTPPFSWRVSDGEVPLGLSLSSSGFITGTVTGLVEQAVEFEATVTDSSTPQQKAKQRYEILPAGFAMCPQDRGNQPHPDINQTFSMTVYPNLVAQGAMQQSITLYACLAWSYNGYGTLTLITPPGVQQQGDLVVVGPAPYPPAVMIQGYVDINSNASLGTGLTPPMIGLKQVLNGTEYDYGPVPYYITEFCPASLTLASSEPETFPNSPLWNQGYRTGVGIYVGMQANPTSGFWNGAFIWETVNTEVDSCPVNLCKYVTTAGMVDGGIHLRNGNPDLSPKTNILWDQHTWADGPNDLVQWGLNSCNATCVQWYFCGNTVEGTFDIEYTLGEKTFLGTSYTDVGVSKY